MKRRRAFASVLTTSSFTLASRFQKQTLRGARCTISRTSASLWSKQSRDAALRKHGTPASRKASENAAVEESPQTAISNASLPRNATARFTSERCAPPAFRFAVTKSTPSRGAKSGARWHSVQLRNAGKPSQAGRAGRLRSAAASASAHCASGASNGSSDSPGALISPWPPTRLASTGRPAASASSVAIERPS